MGLFYRRPAAGVFAAFIVSALVGFFISGVAKLAAVIIIVTVAACAALLLLSHRKTKATALISALAAALALGLAVQGVYFDIIYAGMAKYTGECVTVRATVISQNYSNVYSSGYYIRVSEINGTKCRVKAMLDCGYEGDLRPGEGICITAEAVSLADGAGDGFWKYGDLADGVMMKLTSDSEDDCHIIAKDVFDIEIWLSSLNRRLGRRLRGGIPGQPGELITALLLGDRSGLSSTVRRDFNRSGVSHLLALSGLHLTVIIGLAGVVLKKLRVPKVLRCVILPIGTLAYLALTGFSLSACRAAVMLCIMYMAFFVSARPDSVTSLFGAVALIILLSPSSVLDVGLWLSMLAALGLILGLPILDDLKNHIYNRAKSRRQRHSIKLILKPILSYLLIPLLGTLVANAVTCLVVWLVFGRLSLFSMVTNLILSPLTGLLLFIGVMALSMMWCPPVFSLLAALCGKVADLMLSVTHRFSLIPGGVISLRYDFAGVLIVLMTVALAVLAVVRLKHRSAALLPVPVTVVAFAVALTVYNGVHAGQVELGYLRDGNNEALVASFDGQAVVCDLGDGSYSNFYRAARQAGKDCATHVSALVLTHYHQRHISSVYRFCGSELVERIYLPYPEDEREYNVMWSLIYNAGKSGCEVVIYRDGQTLELSETLRLTVNTSYIKRSTHPTLALRVDCGGDTLTYVGASVHESNIYDDVAQSVSDSTAVIFGAHGPKIKSRFGYSEGAKLELAVFATADCAVSYDFDAAPMTCMSVGMTEYWHTRMGEQGTH